jgi:hypothetical protein
LKLILKIKFMKKHLTLIAMALLSTAFAQTALPIDFESTPPTFTVFGNSTYSVLANPDMSGLNTSATVLETVHGNETWAGLFFDVTNKLDFTTDTLIEVMVWAPVAGTMRLKLEDKTNGALFWEADQAISVASQWTKLTWDLSGVGTLYDRIVLFPGWGLTSGTYYVDNIDQGTASGIGMGEKSVNVLTLAPNPTNDLVNISFNADNAHFSVVSLTGQIVAKGILTEGQNALSTASFSNGIYMVRVSSDAGTSVQKLVVRH